VNALGLSSARKEQIPMKRLLMLLAVAAVAAALYATTAPGSLQTGPSAQQFAALKKKVSKLQKQVTSAKRYAEAALGIEALCIMHKPVGADQVGTATSGYLFGPPQTAPTAVTAATTAALSLAPTSETSPQHEFYELNTSQADCVKLAKLASTLDPKRVVARFAASR
jgi:hypothetical protein